MRVCSVRSQQSIAPYQEGERKARGEVTLNEAADILAVSPSTVSRMIGNGLLRIPVDTTPGVGHITLHRLTIGGPHWQLLHGVRQ
jgi:hypothetical protein